jgi:hypothetical protein
VWVSQNSSHNEHFNPEKEPSKMDTREILSDFDGAGTKKHTFVNTTLDKATHSNTRGAINSPGCYNHPMMEAE